MRKKNWDNEFFQSAEENVHLVYTAKLLFINPPFFLGGISVTERTEEMEGLQDRFIPYYVLMQIGSQMKR